jgi:hypothetical protein
MVPINYWAVIVAAIVNVVLGFLWYGPFFGKQWIALMNLSKEQMDAAKAKGMGKSYALTTIGSLVMSYVLAYVFLAVNPYFAVAGILGVAAGLTAGALIWLGFVAPVTLGPVLWDGKPWKLWFLNAGYYLVTLLIMGVVFAVWQ